MAAGVGLAEGLQATMGVEWSWRARPHRGPVHAIDATKILSAATRESYSPFHHQRSEPLDFCTLTSD